MTSTTNLFADCIDKDALDALSPESLTEVLDMLTEAGY